MLLSTIYQVKCFIDRSFLLKNQPAQETLPPVTGAGTVQGIAIFYALPAMEYHVEMK